MKKIICYSNQVLSIFLLILGIILTSCTEDMAPIMVSSVTLDTTSMTLTEGDSQTITATISPSDAENKTILWISSNSAVASVEEGVVTAIAPGTATITAETEDGAKTATCKVTVVAKVYPVTGVSLDKTSVSLTEGETITLTATINPENATNKNVSWKSDNTSIATVADGKVTAVKAGTTTITVTTEDGKHSASCSIVVKSSSSSWGICGTFNNWGEDGEDIPMLSNEYKNYYVVKDVNLKSYKTDDYSFVFRYDNSWEIHRGAHENDYVFNINKRYSTGMYEDGAYPIFVTQDGVYDIYLAKSLDYFYIMSKGQKPDDVESFKIPVNGVTIDKTDISLIEGETVTLACTVTPSNATDKSVTWQSSNTNVATVNNSGLVTAVKKGNSVITVKTKDGEYVAECKVTVNTQTPTDNITLNSASSNSISYEEKDYTISFTTANNWSASTNNDWITISPKSGNPDSKTITVHIAENTAQTARTGSVVITSGTTSATVYYTQEGNSNDDNYDDYSKISMQIDLNSAFNANLSDDAWLESIKSILKNADMTDYGATYKDVKYNNGWISICFDDNVTAIPRANPLLNVYGSYAQTIVLPNSITHIGDYAFEANGCPSINIPESLQEIGECAFANATCIKDLVLPQGVTAIGQGAFSGCSITSLTTSSYLTKIPSQAFINCTSLSTIVISSSVQQIGTNAFAGCKVLSEITIPSSVRKIDEYAFSDCSGLINVTIGKNTSTATMEIGQSVFQGCTSLTKVSIGSEVKLLGYESFNGCSNLKTLVLGSNKTNGTMNINYRSFANCTSLSSLTMGSEVNEIGSEAFLSCTHLQSLTIPGTVTLVGESAFENCSSLKNIVIGGDNTNNKTFISPRAFYGCNSIEEMVLSRSVSLKEAENSAFRDCTGILRINCPLDDYIISPFSYSNFKSIVIGDEVEGIGEYTFKDISCKEITLGANVKTIGKYAFAKCTLNKFTLPLSLNTINSFAFYETTINSDIYIHKGLKVESSAFHNASLQKIEIASGAHLEGGVFNGCTGTSLVTNCLLEYNYSSSEFDHCYCLDASPYHDHKFSSITIGDNIYQIGDAAFLSHQDHTINEIIIGENVKNIGYQPFTYNSSSLPDIKTVYVKATTPPTHNIIDGIINQSTLNMFTVDTKIYVPRNSVNLYKTAEYWKEYANNIYGYDF